MDRRDDTSASGFIESGFEGMSATFTDIEVMRTTPFNILARAKRYGKWWMLKGISPEVEGSVVHSRMLCKEFDMLMSLSHHSVVQAVSLEDVKGLGMCIVMEYVEGVTLNEWAETHPLRTDRIRIVSELLEAVSYIHSCGIAHRDLKPANIMVATNGGTLKIIDFGLADSDRDAILKQPAGTHRYMSPEQASMAEADVRNDIFSIGVILQNIIPWRRYRHITRKCLLPINARYQSVAELQAAFTRMERIRSILHKACYVALLLVVAVVSWFGNKGGADAASQEMIDSLHMVVVAARANIDSVKAHSSAKIDSMQRAITGTKAGLKAMQDRDSTDNARADAFRQKYENGYVALEKCWQRDLINYDATASVEERAMYVCAMYEHLQQTAKQYVNRHSAGLSEDYEGLLNELMQSRIVFQYYPKGNAMMEN